MAQENKLDAILNSVAQKVKETRTVPCSHCGASVPIAQIRPCPEKCLKRFYCKEACIVADRKVHQKVCQSVAILRRSPGFRNRFVGSRGAKAILYEFGRAYLSADCKGVVAFTRFPLSRREWLESQLRGTKSTARLWEDPAEKNVIYHYYLMPVSALRADDRTQQDFDESFVSLCEVFDFGASSVIPTIQFIPEDPLAKDMEISHLSYFLLTKDELSL